MAKLSAESLETPDQCGLVVGRICAKCGLLKAASDFYKLPKTRRRDGLSPNCKGCDSDRTKKYRARSPKDRLSISLNTARTSSKKKKIPFEISIETLISLWESQNGKCYYTGVSMSFAGNGSPESVSLDRIDSSNGYTPDNVALCCAYVNRMKSDLPAGDLVRWCKLVVEHMKGV